jgi:hypothetical protein
MSCALVTLAIGDRFRANFNRWFRPSWEAWCVRHGHALVVIEQPLDTSARALARSPAWQKLIVHRHPTAACYDRLAWVDADILINPTSPDLFAAAPLSRVAAVDEFATPSREAHRALHKRLYAAWARAGIPHVPNLEPADFHAHYGLPAPHPAHVVQTGLYVYSPAAHGTLLERVYHDYEDKGDPSWNYEMRPLSQALQRAELVHWLDPRWNFPWSFYQGVYYPFLQDPPPAAEGMAKAVYQKVWQHLHARCVQTAAANTHGLHFVGGSPAYQLLPP